MVAEQNQPQNAASLAAENAAMKAQIQALTQRMGELEAEGKTGVGKAPIPRELKPTGLLEGLVVKSPENIRDNQRLYRCGIKPEVQFPLDIRVGVCNFSSRTARWDGVGEDAMIHERKGSIVALTDAEFKDVVSQLAHRYIRVVTHKDGTILGLEDVDASDGGSLHVDPVTKVQTRQMPSRVSGRTRGDERPLADILILEAFGAPLQEHSVKAALVKAQAEEEERQDIEAMALAGVGGFEEGRGGKRSRPKKILHDLSTVRSEGGAPTQASGGLLS